MTTQQNGQTAVVEEQGQVRLALQEAAQEKETSELEEAVVALLDLAVLANRCAMCEQGDENHTDACLVPYLEDWLAKQYQ